VAGSALTSAFLELIDDAGRPFLCDELRKGESYRVVMTNPGGFYRYDWAIGCAAAARPTIAAARIRRPGRRRERSRRREAERAIVQRGPQSRRRPACLAPRASARPFYELLVEEPGRRCAATDGGAHRRAFVRKIRNMPMRAHRQLGRSCRVRWPLLDRYLRAETQRGRRLADIKPPALIGDAPLRRC